MCNNMFFVTGWMIESHTARAVLIWFGKLKTHSSANCDDSISYLLSLRSRMNTQVLFRWSNLHSIILLSYCFRSRLKIICAKGSLCPVTKSWACSLVSIPWPPDLVMRSLKSTELSSGGFHFKMSSLRPFKMNWFKWTQNHQNYPICRGPARRQVERLDHRFHAQFAS